MKNEKPQFKNLTKKRKTLSTHIDRSMDTREIRRCTDIPGDNAARERSRVKSLRTAFADLQRALPCVPPDTKLSKLDVLVLASTYIAQLMKTLEAPHCRLDENQEAPSHYQLAQNNTSSRWDNQCFQNQRSTVTTDFLHPVKKWPTRSRLYVGLAATAKIQGTTRSSRRGVFYNTE